MPAKDIYHDTVKRALEKDGWIITHDPFNLKWGRKDAYVDLGAEKILSAEKEGRKIAVEIKSFAGKSEMRELEIALGQFVFYRFLMQRYEPQRVLFLAVPKIAYNSLFISPEGLDLIENEKLKIIVYDINSEEIVRWIN